MNAPAAKPSFLRTVKTVAWSFIGIRKNSEYKHHRSPLGDAQAVIWRILTPQIDSPAFPCARATLIPCPPISSVP